MFPPPQVNSAVISYKYGFYHIMYNALIKAALDGMSMSPQNPYPET